MAYTSISYTTINWRADYNNSEQMGSNCVGYENNMVRSQVFKITMPSSSSRPAGASKLKFVGDTSGTSSQINGGVQCYIGWSTSSTFGINKTYADLTTSEKANFKAFRNVTGYYDDATVELTDLNFIPGSTYYIWILGDKREYGYFGLSNMYLYIDGSVTGTITYNANTGSGSSFTQTITYGTQWTASSVTNSGFTKTGYTLSKWNTAADGSGTPCTPGTGQKWWLGGKNFTLYAQWTANSYTCTINPNGGTYKNSSGSNSTGNTSYTFTGAHSYVPISTTGSSGYSSPSTDTGIASVYYISQPTKTGYTFNKWTTSPSLTVTSYSFGSGVSMYSIDGNPYKSFTATAQWTANTYTITLNGNGGTLGSTKSVWLKYNTQWQNSSGSAITSIAQAPTRTGYTFKGFYTAASGGTKIINADKTFVSGKLTFTSSDTTLYAQWTPNKIKLTLNRNGGTGGTSSVWYYYGIRTFYSNEACTTTITKITCPTRTGYTFDCYYGDGTSGGTNDEWYINSSAAFASDLTTDIYKDATLKAKWIANTVRIAYYKNGGTIGSADYEDNGSGYIKRKSDNNVYFHTLNYDSTDTDPYNASTFGLTKTGYSFNQWKVRSSGQILNQNEQQTITNYAQYDDKDKTAANTSLVTCYLDAQWSANTNTAYKVKHWKQNIDAATTPSSTNYTLAETQNLTGTTGASVTPSRKTYTGFTSPSGTTITIAADGSSVVNYYYTRDSYTVTLTKGTGISSISGAGTYQYEKSVTIKATVSTGYTWSKWTGTKETTTQNYTFTMPASNVSNKANATLNTYTISYTLNGGSVATANPTSYNVTTTTFTLNNPTKTGHTFSGWTGTGLSSASKSVSITKGSTGNRSYTANWTANDYTITFNANGGILPSGLTSLTTKYDTTSYWSWGALANATKLGYSLKGYYDAASGGNKIYNANGTCYAGGTYWNSDNKWKYDGNVTAYAQWTARNLVKIYNGSSWVNAVPLVYDGSTWKETIPYVYSSGWKQCK